jgi:uncharacterized membrane protein YkvA (DUF1232 family)
MSYKLTIELSARDLRHFHRELRKARESVRIADDEEILSAAEDMVKSLRATELPDFVTGRLDNLETMLAMLSDADWPLTESERNPLLGALAYLCDPEDIIPDDIPGVGLLDDAVMIELVFRDLQHEIEAYDDFSTFRAKLRSAGAKQDPAVLTRKLASRREQLLARMHRRKKKK